MARFMRTDLGSGHSKLRPPAVVGAGKVYQPIRGTLFPLLGAAAGQRKQVTTHLRAPVVVAVQFRPRDPSINFTPRSAVHRRNNQRGVLKFLRPPVQVLGAVELLGPETTLAYQSRRAGFAQLSLPAVVGDGVVFEPIKGVLTPLLSHPQRGVAKSRLSPPVVVDQPALVTEPRVSLASQRKGVPRSLLRPPAVVGGVHRAVQIEFAYSRRGAPRSRLAPPIVVIAAFVASDIQTRFAPQPRTQTRFRLFPPAVVGAGIVHRAVLVHATYSLRGAPTSRLAPPAVVEQPSFATGLRVALAPQRRGVTRSFLTPPASVGVGIPDDPFAPIKGYLFPLLGAATSLRRTIWGLGPPIVIEDALVYVAVTRLRVALAASKRGSPRSFLSPPAVVGAGIANVPIRGHLFPLLGAAPSLRRPIWVLSAPVVIGDAPLPFRGLIIRPARFVPRAWARPRFVYPVVIFAARNPLGGTGIWLAPSFRGRARWFLRAPVVVGEFVTALYFGPSTVLAPSRRVRVSWQLRPPVIPPLARTTRVAIARSRRGLSLWLLAPPVLVDLRPQVRYLSLTLAYSLRGKPRSRLAPPTLTGVGVVQRAVQTSLAYSRRGTSRWLLRAPVIPVLAPRTRVSLAPQRKSRPWYALGPPVAVRPGVESPGVRVSLASGKRGYQRSFLSPPTVVAAGIAHQPIRGYLFPLLGNAPSLRRTLSLLAPPTVVQPAGLLFYGPRVRLTFSRRGRPLSLLAPPALVGAGITYRAISVWLAPAIRTRTISRLRTPLFPPLARPLEVTLTRLDVRRRRPRSLLRLVILPVPVARAILVALAPSSRGVPRTLLRPPAVVVAFFIAQPVGTRLVRIRPTRTLALLRPPAVVGGGIVHRGIRVWLTYQSRGSTLWLLQPPKGVVVEEGTVCGDDEPTATVCGDDEPIAVVCGDDEGATVCGEDEATQTVGGGAAAAGSVGGE